MSDNAIKFEMIGERKYYANKSNNVNESVFSVENRFRLSYYIDLSGFLYVYYIGNYYQCDLRGLNISEIDIIQNIIAQCSDPRLYNPENIELD